MKRLQNKIAESRWALPVTLIVTASLWVLRGLGDPQVWPCLACMVIATLFMVELNNSNSLIRIYSRMVSSSFAVMMTMAEFVHTSLQASVVTLCAVGLLLCLFKCYQDHDAPGWVFYAFLCVGLASLVWVQVFFFLPLLWIIMATMVYCMGPRNLAASFLGLITPYWFYLGYCALQGDIMGFVGHFVELAEFQPLWSYGSISVMQWGMLAILVVCALIGAGHFWATIYNDKIRTRMLYQTFCLIDFVAFAFLVLQPQHFIPLWCIMAVCTAPLIAHFIALTKEKLSSWTTYALMLIAAGIMAYNCITTLPFFNILSYLPN